MTKLILATTLSKSIYIPLLLVLILSCSIKKKATQAARLTEQTTGTIIDSLRKKPNYYNLKTKANAVILFNEKKNSVKINFRLQRDSVLWTNISKSGVQILTALLSKDSIKFLKKINIKEYFIGDYQQLDLLLDRSIDYSMVEDMVQGNPILLDSNMKYFSTVFENQYLLSSHKLKKLSKLLSRYTSSEQEIIYRYWINPANFKCAKIVINDLEKKESLIAKYSNWKTFEEGTFPLNAEIKFIRNEDTLALNLDFSPNFKFDINQTYPLKINSNYSPITLPSNE